MNRKHFLKVTGITTALSMAIPMLNSSKALKEAVSTSKNDPVYLKATEGNIFNVLGDIQTHKITGKHTDGKFFEWYSNIEPGVSIPLHYHTREDEIFRVINGEVLFVVGDQEINASAGDVLFAPRNVPHAWRVKGEQSAHMITSVFPAGLEVMFEKLSQLPPGPPDFKKITDISEEYGIHFV